MGMVKHWHRFPREVADAPSLGAFKARLDRALSNLIWLKMPLLIAGGWATWPFKVTSNPNYSMILGNSCNSHNSLQPLVPQISYISPCRFIQPASKPVLHIITAVVILPN